MPGEARPSRRSPMTMIRRLFSVLAAVLLLAQSVPAAERETPRLAKPPLGERWFSISKSGEKVGFNRLEIREGNGGFEVISESDTRMTGIGFSRDATSRERYLINRDLSLRSFEVEEVIDGKTTRVKGEAAADGVRVTVEAAGKTREKTLKAKGAVYPPPVLNIYPLLQGGGPGQNFRLKMLDIEDIKIKDVKMSVIGLETLAGGIAALHMQNDLYPIVDNDIWVDLAGNTVRESVRHGLIVTQAEEGDAARRLLLSRPWRK
jgi:hypothetical protein